LIHPCDAHRDRAQINRKVKVYGKLKLPSLSICRKEENLQEFRTKKALDPQLLSICPNKMIKQKLPIVLIVCVSGLFLAGVILIVVLFAPPLAKINAATITTSASASADVFELPEVKAYLSSSAAPQKQRGRAFVDAVSAMQRINGRPNPITRNIVLRVCGVPDEDVNGILRVFFYHYDFRQQDEILAVEFDSQDRVASFDFNVDILPPTTKE
jgi:hypothetical protein